MKKPKNKIVLSELEEEEALRKMPHTGSNLPFYITLPVSLAVYGTLGIGGPYAGAKLRIHSTNNACQSELAADIKKCNRDIELEKRFVNWVEEQPRNVKNLLESIQEKIEEGLR